MSRIYHFTTNIFTFVLLCGPSSFGGARVHDADASRPSTSLLAEVASSHSASRNILNTVSTRLVAETPGGPSTENCLKWLSDADVDSMYKIDPPNIHIESIQDSKGWEAGQFNFGAAGNKPYLAGPIASGDTSAGQHPTVAIIGNSHCEMHGPLLERLAQSLSTSIGILCADGGSQGQLKNPLRPWDQTRIDYLKTWRPQHIVWLDFWHGDTKAPWAFDGYNFDYALNTLAPFTKKITLFGDVPTLPLKKQPSNDMFKQTVLKRYEKEGSFAFLKGLKEDPDYRERRLALEATIKTAVSQLPEGQGHFVPLATYFIDDETQNLQLVDPATGGLTYKDFSHINVDGGSRLEQVFRKEIFNQKICDAEGRH